MNMSPAKRRWWSEWLVGTSPKNSRVGILLHVVHHVPRPSAPGEAISIRYMQSGGAFSEGDVDAILDALAKAHPDFWRGYPYGPEAPAFGSPPDPRGPAVVEAAREFLNGMEAGASMPWTVN